MGRVAAAPGGRRARPPSLVVAIQKAPSESSVREPIDVPIERNLEEAPESEPKSRCPRPLPMLHVTALEPPTVDEQAEPAPVDWMTRLRDVVPRAIAGLWLTVSLVLTIRLTLSLFAGWRIARQAREEQNPRLLAALREAAEALSLKSVPRLRVSPFARCPMIWCWGSQPVVLLPDSAIEQAPVLWRSVFCHELAHLVRSDHWSALWAEVVVILLPWQPLVWRCRRHLAFLREQACDDWVLAAGGAATDYAESLLQFVPQGSPVHALAAVSSRESLKRRLEHVLSGMRIAPNVGRRWIVVASLVALVAIAGVGFAQQGKRSPVPSGAGIQSGNREGNPATRAQDSQKVSAAEASAAGGFTSGDCSPRPCPVPCRMANRARGVTVRAMTPVGLPFNAQVEGKLLSTFSTNAEGLFEGKISGPLRSRPALALRRISRRRETPVSQDDEDRRQSVGHAARLTA